MSAEAGAIERFGLGSLAPEGDRYAILRDLIPEAFSEGQLDPDALAAALGEAANPESQELYGLSWPGKVLASAALQEPSLGTLTPVVDPGSRATAQRDVLIEGDNLEVLKLLQRAYFGKVKMIYIDPPYNTGKEFIYPDNFREGLESYLQFTGQADDDGRKLSANAETSGRYHSSWLSMMYPRLSLARNLLRHDGVIFVTIDDHEVHNLRLLMDDVFGPENFVATCIWQKVFSPKNSARHFSEDHDYVLVYARSGAEWTPNLLPRTEEMEDRYSNPDNDPRGRWTSADLSARNFYSKGTYSITTPRGRTIEGPPRGMYWRVSKDRFEEMDRDGQIWWGPDGDGQPRQKRYLSRVKDGKVPQTLWRYQDVGHTQEAKKELLARVEFATSDSVFETPKPTRLIERMLRLATSPTDEDIVLDFFAGSGSTGEAVWKLNEEDGGKRRFVLVQLPEPTGYSDYETVADITRARLEGAADAIAEVSDSSGDLPLLGFRRFRLEASNFNVWDSSPDLNGGEVTLLEDGTVPGSTTEGIIAELLLKAGFELTTEVKLVELHGLSVHAVAGGELLLVTDGQLTVEAVEDMVELQPSLVLVLDRCFGEDDELKVNVLQTVRAANQGSTGRITLKVV